MASSPPANPEGLNFPPASPSPREPQPRCRAWPWRGVLVVLAAGLGCGDARAVAFRVPNQDARAVARGNAFTATADNPSAVYYNPAGLSFLEGTSWRASAYPIWLEVEHEAPGGGRVRTRDRLQGVAQLYVASASEQRPWAWGLGLYTPYGLGVLWPDEVPFRALGSKAELLYLALNPVVSWRPTSTLALAAGVSGDWGKVTLRQGLGPGPADQLSFSGTDFNLSATAGVMWRPWPQHSFGVAWRGPGGMTFDGEADFALGGARFRQDATWEVDLPQHVMGGWSFRPTPAWNIEVNVNWTDWDVVDTATLRLPDGAVPVAFDWRSGFMYAVGLTHTRPSGLALSAGYWYGEETIPDARYKPIVPDVALHVVSAGLGWRWGAWDLEAVYQVGIGPPRTVVGSEGGLADGRYTYLSHALSLAAGRKF